MVWLAFALMTAAVVLCLIWPLSGQRVIRPGRAADLAFYRSQLTEVDEDIGRGLVAPSEADATRAEIGRRLLASMDRAEPEQVSGGFRLRRIGAVLAAVVAVPLVAIPLYLHVGAPDQPDMPIAARDASPGFRSRLRDPEDRSASGGRSHRWSRLSVDRTHLSAHRSLR